MKYAFDPASDLTVDVRAEAERLVKLGVPPWEAIIHARQRITRQRQRDASRAPQEGKTPS